jgi:hypothetical protein
VGGADWECKCPQKGQFAFRDSWAKPQVRSCVSSLSMDIGCEQSQHHLGQVAPGLSVAWDLEFSPELSLD